MREVIVLKRVLQLMQEQVQSRSVEVGGILYGKMNPGWLLIESIGSSGPKSKQTAHHISFDMNYLQDESCAKAQDKLFAVGTWHSHPLGASLKPSSLDVTTMRFINSYFHHPMLPVFCICSIMNNELLLQWYEIDGSLSLPINCNISYREE